MRSALLSSAVRRTGEGTAGEGARGVAGDGEGPGREGRDSKVRRGLESGRKTNLIKINLNNDEMFFLPEIIILRNFYLNLDLSAKCPRNL